MRRHYAFEADNLTDNVRGQLERVEDAVDSKCRSVAACESMLARIEAEEDKFNGALESMVNTAKAAQSGAIDRATMASQIAPVSAELKEIAGNIGVATESVGVSQTELNDVRAYISGAKEIVESKLDELSRATESDEGDEPKDDKKDDDKKDDKGDDEKKDDKDSKSEDDDESEDDGDEDEEEAEAADESYAAAIESCIDGAIVDAAMEGANVDALAVLKEHNGKLRALKKEFRSLKKAKDFKGAAAKAREIAQLCSDSKAKVDQIPASVGSAVIANVGMLLISAATTGLAGAAGGAIGSAAATGKVVGSAVKVAGVASAAAGAGSAAGAATGNTLVRFLQKKGIGNGATSEKAEKAFVVNREDLGKKLDANDFNAIISSIKVDLTKAADTWTRTAKALENKSAQAATESDLSDAQWDAADESWAAAVESCIDEATVAAAMEGANADALAALKEHNAKMRSLKKEFRGLNKAKDFNGAAAKASEMAQLCRDSKAKVDQIPASVGSAVIANLGMALVSAAGGAAIGAAVGAGGLAAAGAATGIKVTGSAAAGAALYGGVGGAAAGVGSAAGSGVGNTLVRLLQKKGVANGAKSEKAEKTFVVNREDLGKKLDANDFNAIIAAIKVDLTKDADTWDRTAKALKNKASGANESFGDDMIEGFVAACESVMIQKSNAPYLFD